MIAALDRYIEQLIEPWRAVGLTVGVIHRGEVVMKKAYGMKRLATREPMTPDTRFAIGSASKAFTAAAIGILIEQGKIKSFDDKVRTYLPRYETADPYAACEMTIKDLLAMRSGYSYKGYDNMLFHGSHYTMDEIAAKSKYIPFDLRFRDRMRYDNLNYILCGKIIEAACGKSWFDFMQDEIFSPLGMTNSGCTHAFAAQSPAMATPHLSYCGEMREVPVRNIDCAGPAGSIVSDLDDMLRWTAFQMGDGTAGGRRLIAETDMARMHTPYSVIDKEFFVSSMIRDITVPAYALGWMVYDFCGVPQFGHGGHIDGFSSWVGVYPEHDTGIVMLCNADHNDIAQPILRTLSDLLSDQKPRRDYHKEFLDIYLSGLAQYKTEYDALMRKLAEAAPLAQAPSQYAGTYRSDLFDEVHIVFQDGTLQYSRHDWLGTLHPLAEDRYVALWPDITHPPLKVDFLRCDGAVTAVSVEMFGTFSKT